MYFLIMKNPTTIFADALQRGKYLQERTISNEVSFPLVYQNEKGSTLRLDYPVLKILSRYDYFPLSVRLQSWSTVFIMARKALESVSLISKFHYNFRNTFTLFAQQMMVLGEMKCYFLLCHTFDGNRHGLLDSVDAIFLLHGLINLSSEELLKIILNN